MAKTIQNTSNAAKTAQKEHLKIEFDDTLESISPQQFEGKDNPVQTNAKPTASQRLYLQEGLKQAGGKLPIFNKQGQFIPKKTIEACVAKGWAEPWFFNPLKPDWLVCKLTKSGKEAVS